MLALWQIRSGRRYRSAFPVTQNLIYLNHAAVAPLCRPAAEAMAKLAEEVAAYGSLHYDRWLAEYEGLRESAARLLAASPREIAIVKNTSEGIATVALGIDWRVGDRVVCFREEFPANLLPWKRLESRGVRIDWLSAADPLDKVDAAARGARLLAVSFVQYLSGFRADLEAIGEICRRRGCFFFVDAIQGLGVFPVEVRRFGIHALAADGHKWLLGPEGCGILYVAHDAQDEITPVEFGWTNVARYWDYEVRDTPLRPDAGRYECGTLNTIGCFGLRASIDLLLDAGIDAVSETVLHLAGIVAEGAQQKGYELLGPASGPGRSGIVSIRKPGLDSKQVVAALRARRMLAAERHGWIRLSPHFYLSPDEAAAVVEALPAG
jgi:cysteine desulfurase/selenocysteine lyase